MIIERYTDFRYRFGIGGTAFDGREEWDPSLLRANGFDDGLAGFPKPITAFPVDFSIVGADSPTAYDWYLSCRTDTIAKRYTRLTQPDPALSGSVRIALWPLAALELGLGSITSAVTEDDLKIILNSCWLYCRRNLDGAVQVFDLTLETLGA